MTPTHVMMFAKAPVEGRVKTRLHPPLTLAQAASLHAAFLKDLTQTLTDWAGRTGASWSLHGAGDLAHDAFAKIHATGVELVPQQGQGLGDRLARATRWARGAGAREVVIIGSDSPTLQAEHLTMAAEAARGGDVALGPSFDGGYYVIGLPAEHDAIFEGVAWSDPRTCHSQTARIRELELSVRRLPFWYDVDTIEDVQLLADHLSDHLAHQHPGKYGGTIDMLRQIQALGLLAPGPATPPTHR